MSVGSDGVGVVVRREVLAVVDDVAFYTARNAAGRACLWRSDGSPAGTRIVGCNGDSGFDAQMMAAIGNALFFVNSLHSSAFELWRSDGTEAGTRLVRRFEGYSRAHLLADIGWSAALMADAEIWRSDGTDAGTEKVVDLPSAVRTVAPVATGVRGRLHFTVLDSTGVTRVWSSDGTPGGTVVLADLGPAPFQFNEIPRIVEVGGWLYFAGYDAPHGIELWRSDGTTSGTKLMADVVQGPASSHPRMLSRSRGRACFVAWDAAGGLGVWATTAPAAPDPRRTATRISTEDVSSVFGNPITITTAVEGVAQAPTGSVTLFDGGAALATLPLAAPAQGPPVAYAAFRTSILDVGHHAFRAEYSGGGELHASASSVQSHVVTPAPSSLRLTITPNPSPAGAPSSLIATVEMGLPVAPPGGSVTFTDAGTGVVGDAAVDAFGHARLDAVLPGGTRFLKATYAGEARFLPSGTGYRTQTVLGPAECPVFVRVLDIAEPNYWRTFLAAADLDGDGSAEILSGDYDGLTLVPSGAELVPGAPIRLRHGAHAEAAVFGDFNGDRLLDAAVSFTTGDVWVASAGGGQGFHFRRAALLPDPSAALAVADMDRDGWLDLLAVYGYPGQVHILHGGGDDTFYLIGSNPAGEVPGRVAAGDVNGDGLVDAVVSHNSETIGVLAGRGDGTLGSLALYPVGADGNLGAIIAADLDADGIDDVALINHTTREVILFHGEPSGLGHRISLLLEGLSGAPIRLDTGDFDRDGRVDLAVSYGGWNPATIELLLGTGRWGEVTSVLVPTFHMPGHTAVGDLNGDGKEDLVVANGETLAAFLNACGRVATETVLEVVPGSTAGPGPMLSARVIVPGGVPTGTITLRADGAELMTIALGRNPQVLAHLPRLTPGEYMVTAEYSGDPAFSGSTSPPSPLVVDGDVVAPRVRPRLPRQE